MQPCRIFAAEHNLFFTIQIIHLIFQVTWKINFRWSFRKELTNYIDLKFRHILKLKFSFKWSAEFFHFGCFMMSAEQKFVLDDNRKTLLWNRLEPGIIGNQNKNGKSICSHPIVKNMVHVSNERWQLIKQKKFVPHVDKGTRIVSVVLHCKPHPYRKNCTIWYL